MIQIEHLTKRFGKVIAVNDFSISVDKGIYGLVGENGAGKSTLLRLISDVYDPNEGQILIDGLSNKDIESKRKIFFLCDKPYVPVNTTVKEVFTWIKKDSIPSWEDFHFLLIERFQPSQKVCNVNSLLQWRYQQKLRFFY